MFNKSDIKLVLGRNATPTANNYVVHVNMTESAPNVATNKSTLTYKMWIDSPDGTTVTDYAGVSKKISGWAFDNFPITGYININGVSFATQYNPHVSVRYPKYSDTSIPTTYTLIAEGSKEIEHNSDGNLHVDVVAGITSTDPWSGVVVSGSMSFSGDLEPIARKSTLSVSANQVMGTATTLTINSKNSGFTHSISYKFGSQNVPIVTKTTSGSVSFTPPTTLGSQIPTKFSDTITYTIETFNGSTSLGTNTATATLSIPSSGRNPSGSASLTLVNDNATVRGWGISVKGYSKYSYSVSATGKYGATIAKYDVSFASQKFTSSATTTGVVNVSGNQALSCTVTDTRGLTGTITSPTVFINDYSSPRITSSYATRCDADGNIRDDGDHVKIAVTATRSCDSKNGISYKYRYKEANGAWSAYQTITTQPVISNMFSPQKMYHVEIVATDSLGNSDSVQYPINTAFVPFNIKDNEKGAAFFGYSVVDGELTVYGNLRVTGTIINN